jgi:GNAT superfamily N-acetyltransferase
VTGIRPLRRDEPDVLDALFEGMSAQSRYLRFHAPVPRLVNSLRTALLDVDGDDRVAVVAEVTTPDGTVPVGIARLGRTGPDEAEVAIAVVDAWHRRGIGRRLLTDLGEIASGLGYRRMHALVLRENAVAVHLFRAVFPDTRGRFADGVLRLEWRIGSPAPLTSSDLVRDLQYS